MRSLRIQARSLVPWYGAGLLAALSGLRRSLKSHRSAGEVNATAIDAPARPRTTDGLAGTRCDPPRFEPPVIGVL